MKTPPRPFLALSLMLGLSACLSACLFGTGPDDINRDIDEGKPAKALTTLEEKLASNPADPALNLLAVKARLALCHQRDCLRETPGTTPPLLVGLPKLAANVTGPVSLTKDTSPLTVLGVFQQAMKQYQSLQPQPAAALAVYTSAPAGLQPGLASGLFQPALTQARQGKPADAAQVLAALAKAENLPGTYTYAAQMLAGMFTGQSAQRDPAQIALRSATTPPLPDTAAALLPWAIMAEAQGAFTSPTTPAEVLPTLPERVKALQLPNLLTPAATGAMAQELITASNTPATQAHWQKGWSGTPEAHRLALQSTALSLDPNQPQLWATYLPALVSATLAAPVSGGVAVGLPTFTMPAGTVTSASAPKVAAQLLQSARRLANYPTVGAPLVGFASRLELSKQQQVELEKLSQSLLVKAAEHGDVTSTLALARTLPDVAQNNRQSVVPLLVRYIRANLREGNFTAAANTADLLTKTLKMDVEFAPLIIEEFEDDLKRRKVAESLAADTPDVLLEPADEVVLDLGPLFTFMQDYFQGQPKVIAGQLTTLIAEAGGTYGQPTAMYRLGSYFPPEGMTPDKQQEWLAASMEQALLADTHLNGPQLAETAARLAEVHPGLNLAPLMETAIRRASTLEEQRSLWQASTPTVREVFRAVRPEFVLLMQGIDAVAAGQLNTAAQAFGGLTDAQWLTEAKPFIEQFNDRLLSLSGTYVPVSAAPALKTAAIVLSPEGLGNGRLTMVSATFLSRVGTLTEAETTGMRTNAAATHRFDIAIRYDFDTRSLTLTPQAIAQAPQGGMFGATYGNIRTLKLQGDDTPILGVTLADGTTAPFVRTLLDTTQPLRPDGIYLLQSRLGQATSSTQAILPPGSMLTFTTAAASRHATPEDDTASALVFPLSGSVRHPAAAQQLPLSGFFDPEFLTTTFTFSYPLPQSTQPARAAVRCQTLAGSITCGAHNLNSARQAYAALVTGLQTRESAAAAAAARTTLNATSANRILLAAEPVIPSPTLPKTVSGTAGLIKDTSPSTTASVTLLTSTTAISATLLVPSPTTVVSSLLAAPHLTETGEEDSTEETPEPTRAKRPNPFSTGPEPGAFVNNSGGRQNSPTTLVSTSSISPTN